MCLVLLHFFSSVIIGVNFWRKILKVFFSNSLEDKSCVSMELVGLLFGCLFLGFLKLKKKSINVYNFQFHRESVCPLKCIIFQLLFRSTASYCFTIPMYKILSLLNKQTNKKPQWEISINAWDKFYFGRCGKITGGKTETIPGKKDS